MRKNMPRAYHWRTVDHRQERLKQGDEQYRPDDVERAVFQPEGEPLDPEHEDAKQLVHPGPKAWLSELSRS